MLKKASEINGYDIAATDGQLGSVNDCLFDDTSWEVRWMVVETGNWLSGRKVLLSSSVIGRGNSKDEEFPVSLTMQQVKDSPDFDADQPVSRQIETSINDYYGWNPYWGDGGQGAVVATDTRPGGGSQLLRSIKTVSGYHINASDGEIGHVEEFLINQADLSIRYIVVDTKNWWPGKKVLISPRSVQNINSKDELVNLNVTRQKVKDSPTYDPSMTIDDAYDENYQTYYGIKFISK